MDASMAHICAIIAHICAAWWHMDPAHASLALMYTTRALVDAVWTRLGRTWVRRLSPLDANIDASHATIAHTFGSI